MPAIGLLLPRFFEGDLFMDQAKPSLFHDQKNNAILSVKAQKLKGIRKVCLTNKSQRESIEAIHTRDQTQHATLPKCTGTLYGGQVTPCEYQAEVRRTTLKRGHALILIGLLCIIVLRTINIG